MKYTGLGLMLSATLVLSGCATLSEEECLAADWQTIGFEDGTVGKPIAQIGKHREACADHGVPVDLTAYKEGHAEGMIVFCQPGSGFELGNRGGRFNDDCPVDLRAEFYAAYEDGYRAYKLRREVRNSLQDIQRYQQSLEVISEQIKKIEANLVSAEGDAGSREQWLGDLNNLQRQQNYIRGDIEDLQSKIDHRNGEIEYLEDRNRN